MAKRHPPANVVNVHSRHDTRAVKYALISMMDSDMYHTKHILPNKQNIGWSKLYIIRLINIARSYVKHGMRVLNDNNDRIKRSNMVFKLFYPNSDESVIGTNVSSRRAMSINSRLRQLTITLKFLDIVS